MIKIKYNKINRVKFKSNIFYFLILLLMVSIVRNPVLSIDSAKDGLLIWFNILLPSLLPFFVLSELLILSGFVESFGNLLKPIMLPIFNVSGEGSFPLIMSMVSGYPVGTKLTCSLREKNIITEQEGNRLLSFSSTSGPLFMLGAVLVGMLNSPHLKFLMIIPHYLAALTLGLLFRFYNSKNNNLNKNTHNLNIKNLSDNKGNKSLGSILSKSVSDGMNSMFSIGGFVILYSVVIEVLLNSQFILYFILQASQYFNIDIEILKGIFAGIFEISIGAQKIASLELNIFVKIGIINFIIAWGGFSIQSQSLSFISETDLNSKIFIIAKFFHGVFSAIYTYIFYLLIYRNISIPSTIFPDTIYESYSLSNWISVLTSSFKMSILICICFLFFSLFVHLIFLQKKEA